MTNLFQDPAFWKPVLLSLAVALIATPIVRTLARYWGIVAKPKADRWHKKPTAMLGGIAISVAVLLGVIFGIGPGKFSWTILIASTFLGLFGLLDDFLEFKPYQKVIAQIMGAAAVAYSGLLLPWTASPALNLGITIFWIVGLTNAINLLDNMDGLAGGIAAIAAFFLAWHFLANGQMVEGTAVAVMAAALLGFLVYNHNPASIFMGDCGSMFIGFFLATTALLATTHGRTRSIFPIIAVPVLTFLIPIFDTTLVAVWRKLAGRSVAKGGRDHTSHRLVALGLSERHAVWLLYGLGLASGLLALQVKEWHLHESVAAILGFTVVLTLVGVYLSGVKVYNPDDTREVPLVSFLVDISYKRRVFETLLDVTLILLAYFGAHVLRFGRLSPISYEFYNFLQSLPIIVFIKIGVFLATGVYRGLWRYTGVRDLVLLTRAVAIGSVCSVFATVYLFKFYGFSRAVFLLDGLLLLMMMAGSRMAFRVVRGMLPQRNVTDGRRVLIYGAGDAGELLLRELFNNHGLHYAPVGFIDDDPKKIGKVVNGLPVYSGEEVERACKEMRAAEIVVSTSKLSRQRVSQLVHICDAIEVPLRQMRIELELLNAADETDEIVDVNSALPAPGIGPRMTIRAHGSTRITDVPASTATLVPRAEA